LCMTRGTSFLICCTLLVAVAHAATCAPTFATSLGPVYMPKPPLKRDICPPPTQDYVNQAAKDHPYLFREKLKRPTLNKLVVTGTVRSSATCEPLAGAEVDVWHADSDGLYGKLQPDGYCRGYVKADSAGRYEFATQEAGSYGSTRVFFGNKWVPDLPPYGPRHIHVAVWHPTHRLGVYQLYFKDDPAREFDWRNLVAFGAELGSGIANLTISPDADGNARFDFVLQPLAPGERSFASRDDALLARCPDEDSPVPALCSPGVARFLRVEVFVAVTLVWLFVAYRVLRWCLCRSAPSKKKRE